VTAAKNTYGCPLRVAIVCANPENRLLSALPRP
jgi:hypothetical protein